MKHYIKVGGILCLGLGLFTTLSSLEEDVETSQTSYVQSPPIAKQYWVQKIRTPEGVNGGDYSVVLRTRFVHDLPLPDVLNIYKNGAIAQVMQDNGVYPDVRAKDGIFSTIINEDPDVFSAELAQRYINLNSKGYAMQFTGHSGKIIKVHDIKPFNFDGFNQFQEIEVLAVFVEGTSSCDTDDNSIIKQNSLLITDIDVVENQSMTYNVITESGNPQGAWTFGQLIKNMAGGYADEANPTQAELTQVREFIKQWIIQFSTEYTINNRTSPTIDKAPILWHIINPWIKKTKEDLNPNDGTITTLNNWQNIWDSFSVTDGGQEINTLLKNAPFKLSAIVNRIDLRGNAGYSGAVNNAGETRFIFSLVQTLPNQTSPNAITNLGKPPWHNNTAEGADVGARMDWRGMNVILEYANTQTTECDVKDLGQQWKDLSNYDINSNNYLVVLQNITNLVTSRNANPNGVNGSAISQVRTSSKLFTIGNSSPNNVWEPMNWEFREFRLNSSGLLVNRATRNMPFENNNYKRNSTSNAWFNSGFSSSGIVNWIYGVNGPSHKFSVMNGNHNIPEHLLQPSSELKEELQTYYGLGFWSNDFPDDVYDDATYTSFASPQEKEIRHQLSLNTCSGCHAGETKTMFSMIQPLGYGEEADYWSPVPASRTGTFNQGNQTSNIGYTIDPNHPNADANGFIPNYELEYYVGSAYNGFAVRIIPLVSPFLTGRNYRGPGLGVEETWDDDLEGNVFEENHLILGDNKTTGLFYINDPSNEGNLDAENEQGDDYIHPSSNNSTTWDPPFPQLHDKKIGYNELKNRQMDLCLLTNTSCNANSGVFDILGAIEFSPLPLHGH